MRIQRTDTSLFEPGRGYSINWEPTLLRGYQGQLKSLSLTEGKSQQMFGCLIDAVILLSPDDIVYRFSFATLQSHLLIEGCTTQIDTENQNNELFDIHAKAVARFVRFFRSRTTDGLLYLRL